MAQRTFVEERSPFGMLVHEHTDATMSRFGLLKEWVNPMGHFELAGRWNLVTRSQLDATYLGEVTPGEVIPTLSRWQATIAIPASGSKWLTLKPWECFAAGTVCFLHPQYDADRTLLRNASSVLRTWLPVASPQELHASVQALITTAGLRGEIVHEQTQHLMQRYAETHAGMLEIEKRLSCV